jgi:hypothetical protein
MKRRFGIRALATGALVAGCISVGVALPAHAATTVTTQFDSVTVSANPNNYTTSGLPATSDGSTTNWGTINSSVATGMAIDYDFTTPKSNVSVLRLFNNYGNDTSDFDGIGSARVQVFDSAGAVLFDGPLNAGNGGPAFLTSFPTPLDGVAKVRLSNITNLANTTGGATSDLIGWRELDVQQQLSTPTLSTVVNADGYADNVTVAGTEGFDGTLTWTLFGPVPLGASGTCSDADWTGAPTFATGTVAITGDGTVTTRPTTRPTATGSCYSYADTLSGPEYTADAVSAVGQASETFRGTANTTQQQRLNMVKRVSRFVDVNRNGKRDPGDKLYYSFRVTNNGTLAVNGIAVSDPRLGHVTCPATSLNPGASMTCTGDRPHLITAAEGRSGVAANSATVSGRTSQGAVTSPVARTRTRVVPAETPGALPDTGA